MQLSLFPESSLPVNPQPNAGELITAFTRETGWVRVSSEDMQTFTVRGGAHDGTAIGREFIHLFQNT